MVDQTGITFIPAASENVDLSAEMVERLQQVLNRIFLTSEDAVFPYEQMLNSFIESFFDWIMLDDAAFLALLNQLPSENDVDSDPGFLNLELEALLDIPIDTGTSNPLAQSFSGREGGVLDSAISIALSSDTLTSEREIQVTSVPAPSVSQPVTAGPSGVATAPPPTTFPTNTAPITPDIVMTGIDTRTLDFAPPLFQSTGNIFAKGANFNEDGGTKISAYFASPLREDSTEIRNVPGKITLTMPEGNSLVLYTSAIEGHQIGDYVFTLSDPTLVANFPSAYITVDSSGDRYFTYRFVYTLTDVNGDVNVGQLFFVVKDDKPEAANFSPSAITEANIETIGSNGHTTVEKVVSGVLTTPTDANPSFIGANGGNVSNMTLASGTTAITATTITVTDQAGNELILDRVTGAYTYTLAHPFTNINDQPTTLVFTYTLTDNNNNQAQGQLTLVIADDAPIAVHDTGFSDETAFYVSGQLYTGNIFTNDTFGADGGVIKMVNGQTAVGGIITVGTTYGSIQVWTVNQGSHVIGDYIYTIDPAKTKPVSDALGSVIDTVTYQLQDSDGSTSTNTLGMTVDLNQAPTAVSDTYTTNEDTKLTVTVGTGVLSNDTDPDAGDTKIVSAVNGVDANVGVPLTLVSGAIVTVNANGSVSFDPRVVYDYLAVGQNAQDQITYTVKDAEGLTSTTTITFTTTGVNDAPVTLNQSINATEDGPSVGPILFSGDDVDSDDNQATLIYKIISPLVAGEGTVVVNTNTFTYSPGSDFQELAQGETKVVDFTYQATDAHGATSNISTVSITVTGVNDAPVTLNQSINATEDGPSVGPILFSGDDIDSDDNQASLTYTIISNLTAGEGSVVNNNNGTFTYSPGSDFQELAQGETKVVDFTYQATDVHGALSNISTVSITVTGVNDAPVTLNQSINATEDGPSVGPILFSGDDIDSDNNQANLTYTIISPLTKGEGSVIVSSNTFTYSPGSDFQELAQGETKVVDFTYQATDVHGALSNISTVSITVTGVNDAPVTLNQSINATEDGPSVGPTAFAGDDVDSDDNQASLTYAIISPLTAGEGSVVNNGNGTFTYSPGSDFQDLAQGETKVVDFTYQATDSHGALSNISTVSITVTGVNDAPVTLNQSINATEDGPSVGPILFAGDDVDSDNNQANLTYTIISPLTAGEGSVVNNGNGTFTYSPGTDFQDLAQGETKVVDFTYQATDAHGALSNISTVSITVTGVNDAPVTLNQSINATEDGSSVGPTAFAGDDVDSDDNQASLTYSIISPLTAGEGSVVNNGNGTFTYSPGSDFQDLAQGETKVVDFTYQATDSHGALSNISTVSITVTGVNDAPVTLNQSLNATEDGPSVGPILFAGDDVDSDNNQANLTYTIISPLTAGEGSVVNNGNGTFTYSPGTDFQDLAQGETKVVDFTYQATDAHGALSNISTVSITVTGVNDAPVTLNQSINATEDGPSVGPILFSGDDIDSDDNQASLIYTIISPLTAGEGSIVQTGNQFTYSPGSDFQALAEGETKVVDFTYQATDVHGALSNISTVSITVTGVNDIPVAVADSGTTNEDTTLSVTAATGLLSNDTDVDTNDTHTVTQVNGSLANVGTQITLTSGALLTVNADGSYDYNPNSKFESLAVGETAKDSFTYQDSDNHGGTSIATVTVTITGVNDNPVAVADSGTTNEDTKLSVTAASGLLSNDIDVDTSDTHTVTQVNGSLANVGTQITLTSGALLTVNADGSYDYNPNGKFESLAVGETAKDSFTYQDSDNHGGTSIATVTVTITGVNDNPVAVADSGTTNEDTKLSVTAASGLLSNDTDVDTSDTHTVTQVNGSTASVGMQIILASGALLTVNSNGGYDYDPNGAFNYLITGKSATDSFTYKNSDNHGGTSTGTVTITIDGVSSPAVIAGVDTGSVTEDTNATTANFLVATGALTIVDPDIGESIFTASTQTGTFGKLTIDSLGKWDYEADNGQTGIQSLGAGDYTQDILTVQSVDGTTHQIIITINGVNDPAVIGGTDTSAVTEDTNVMSGNLVATGTLTITDLDAGENSFTASTQAGSLGSLTLATNGNWTYTADNSQSGIQSIGQGVTVYDSFAITSVDGTSHQIMIGITGVNDAPVANNVSNTGAEDTTITITLTGSDVDSSDTIASFKIPTLPSASQGTLYTDVSLMNAVVANTALTASGNALTLYFKPAVDFNGTVNFNYLATDNHTADSTNAQATITVTPVSDPAVIGGTDTGSVTEDTNIMSGNLVAIGTLTITDPDAGESSFIASTQTSSLGQLTLATNGNWTYTADNSQSGIQSIGQGVTVYDSFTIKSFDGTSHLIKIGITGVNDAPVVNNVSNSGAEDNTITITLTGSDVDSSDNIASFKIPTLPLPSEGILYLDAGLNNLVSANTDLTATGNVLTLYFKPAANFNGTVNFDYLATDNHAADSTNAQATITVTPVPDPAVISGTDTGAVTEDTDVVSGNLVAIGALTIIDPDAGEASFIASTQTSSLGTLTLATNGNWTYTASNSQSGVQSIGQGNTIDDSFTINSVDGTSHLIKIGITGVNDVPVANNVNNSGAEDSASITITLTGSDVDSGDSIVSFKIPTLPLLSQGTLYTDAGLSNAVLANTALLATGNALTLYFKPTLNFNGTVNFDYLATDNHSGNSTNAQATITVTPVNDPAIIAGIDTGSVTEDTNVTAGNLIAIGLLTVNDVDVGESQFNSATIAGVLGSFSINQFGLWQYTATNSQTGIQSLGLGDNVQEVFMVSSVDGTMHSVTITVNGTNDPAIITGTSTGSVTEDTNVAAGNLVAGGLLNITDVDANEDSFTPSAGSSTLGIGTYTINNLGVWQYTVPNNTPSVQALNTGDTLTDTFTITSVDGTTHQITVTINGQNELVPVVLDLNHDNKIDLISYDDSKVTTNTLLGTADNVNHAIGWVGPSDGILVFDPNDTGKVTDIKQISFAGYVEGAKTDLEGLVAFDSNHDNKLDLGDKDYSHFGVWQDKNGNGVVDQGEYETLAQKGITSISLTSDHQSEVIAQNFISGYTTYQTSDGQSHLAGDVALNIKPLPVQEPLTLQDVDEQAGNINFNSLTPNICEVAAPLNAASPTTPAQAAPPPLHVSETIGMDANAAASHTGGMWVTVVEHTTEQVMQAPSIHVM